MRCSNKGFLDLLKKCIPLLSWLPDYSLKDLKGDLIAGFTVGLTVVPQGLALAQLANLEPQYGLYTAFMGSYMYALFGTCKDLVIGPTSVMALMTAEYVLIGGWAYAALLSFLCGCFQLFLGVFNLGFLMNFISAPVISGFTSAAAIITATMQLKGIFGLQFQSSGFVDTVQKLFCNIPQTNIYDFTMGTISISLLLLLRKFKDKKSNCCSLSTCMKVLQTIWWSCATARNALIVIVSSIFAFICLSFEKDFFSLTQRVNAGIPHFHLPQFSFYHFDQNSNTTVHKNITMVFKDLGSGAITIPLISLLEAIAIAKTFTRGEKLATSKEMIALGTANLMGSFVSAYPVTGSFSRSVINNASGVKTPLGGIISGSFVLFALCLFAPVFHFIPKSCLSAIIFSAVIFMIQLNDVPAMWHTNRLDIVPFLVTFICSFALGLEYGLLFGTSVSLLMLLWKQNNTKISISVEKVEPDQSIIHVHPNNTIYFPSSDRLKGVVCKSLYSQSDISKCSVVIYGDHLKEIDYSTAMALLNLVKNIHKEKSYVIFHITKPSVIKTFKFLEGIAPISRTSEELQTLLTKSSVKIREDTNSAEIEVTEISCAESLIKNVNEKSSTADTANIV